METKKQASSLINTVTNLAVRIGFLDSGFLATLRRGSVEIVETVAFWKLVSSDFIEDALAKGSRKKDSEIRNLGLVIRCIAILTPKGRIPKSKEEALRRVHNSKVGMGEAMNKAGISERRLAMLLSVPDSIRDEHLVRICRWLARSGHNQFNLLDLAFLVLSREKAKEKAKGRIAEDYYRSEKKPDKK